MEKIKFFRCRGIENDGSISIGFWMCENKKVTDGDFYRASDVDARIAALEAKNERLREALKEIENTWPHDGEDAVLMIEIAKAALRREG